MRLFSVSLLLDLLSFAFTEYIYRQKSIPAQMGHGLSERARFFAIGLCEDSINQLEVSHHPLRKQLEVLVQASLRSSDIGNSQPEMWRLAAKAPANIKCTTPHTRAQTRASERPHACQTSKSSTYLLRTGHGATPVRMPLSPYFKLKIRLKGKDPSAALSNARTLELYSSARETRSLIKR